MKRLNHWWDTLSGSTYTSQFVRGNECDYETSGLNRGLKTSNKYLVPVSGQPLNWSVQRNETYSYHANLDYLVGANYGDGLANANVTWGYDAAGNRTSDSAQPGTWSYDNLNRMTASPGFAYTNDVLGNRGTRYVGAQIGSGISTSHQWDMLNRMVGMHSSSSGNPASSYQYRADGLRVLKGVGTYAQPNFNISTWTRYRYDGQMGTEDVESNAGGAVLTLSRYGLGARGIDVVSTTTSSGNTVSYPLYDAHGNNVGLLGKNGSSFTVSNEKSYDAWGGLRSGNNSNGKAGYCASIGHKQDDESGLIYMRARYYEPTSGRFINQDVKQDGGNWFTYCANDPVNLYDFSGKNPLIALGIGAGIVGAILAVLITWAQMAASSYTPFQTFLKLTAAAVTGFMGGFTSVFGPVAMAAGSAVSTGLNTMLQEWVDRGFSGIRWGKVAAAFGIGGALGIAFGAVGALAGTSARIEAELFKQSVEYSVTDIAGGAAAYAVGDALSSGFYP
jgi:RHS repeat-associated protein